MLASRLGNFLNSVHRLTGIRISADPGSFLNTFRAAKVAM